MNIKIFDSELKVMEILWREGDLNASYIAKVLEDEVGWNVNTTYTIIKKLVAKGAIERREPKFKCLPLITKAQVQKQEARELGNKLFRGDSDVFLSAFLDGKKLSKKEITRMKQLVEMLDE
jgi:predicted transcriptional regulator